MKKLSKYSVLLPITIIFYACPPRNIGTDKPTSSLMVFACNGVIGNAAMTDSFVVSSDRARGISAGILAAAQADASNSTKILDSLKGNASVNISGALSDTLHRYMKTTTTVSQDFWQQSYRFTQALCLLEHLRNDKNVSTADKSSILQDERRFINEQQIYENNVKKKEGN